MDLRSSAQLQLRVFAIASRLKEVSADVSVARGEAFELRERIEQITVSSLINGGSAKEELSGLKARLDERETHGERQEREEIRLKGVLFAARRDHLRQLRAEKPNQWIVLG